MSKPVETLDAVKLGGPFHNCWGRKGQKEGRAFGVVMEEWGDGSICLHTYGKQAGTQVKMFLPRQFAQELGKRLQKFSE